MKEQPSPQPKHQYLEDEQGFYNEHFYEVTGLKARPLDFDCGEMVFDTGDLAELRRVRRELNNLRNGGGRG